MSVEKIAICGSHIELNCLIDIKRFLDDEMKRDSSTSILVIKCLRERERDCLIS